MKLTKLFGVVLGLHLGLISILIIQPGCSTTQPPTRFEQEGPVGWDKANSLEEVIPAGISSNANTLDPAFNDSTEVDLRAEPLRPFNDFTSADTETVMPEVEIMGASFQDYTVKSGDSMWAIAKANNLSTEDLLVANGMNKNDILQIGQIIKIPAQSSTAKIEVVTADVYQPTGYNAATTNYEVRGGDTLSRIARRFDTTINAIKAANSKNSDTIFIGEKLLIPVTDSTAAQALDIKPNEPVVAPIIAPPAIQPAVPAVNQLNEAEPIIMQETPAAPVTAEEVTNPAAFLDSLDVAPVTRQQNP
jgi:LysM repeat protein